MSAKFPTVDADGHLEEVHINWKERVPEKYRAMAPERRPASDSHLRLTLEGKPWPKPSGPGVGVGGPYRQSHPRREGMKDPKARLVDMDSEGIEVAVLFGGGLGGTIPALEDAALATELARARNTWVAEYCSENPARLKGTAVLPQQDSAAAVAELRRTVTELGFVGVSLLPNLRGRHIGDP
ncbi:MAG TPA: amidohydrolase family protein, partial [Candidatus Bathyarchaeia archaeon]|nr:amidohydrolase family protein [Candidatus Bathyarchaeia archaeon]